MSDGIDMEWDEESVVGRAVRLWIRKPNEPALAILDAVMKGHGDDDLVPAFDWHKLAPPHPFGELIRQAFAPQLDQIELWLALSQRKGNDCAQSACDEWDRAVCRFEEHYHVADATRKSVEDRPSSGSRRQRRGC